MGLLWISMVTVFPNVLAGFEWYKLGMTLPQVIVSLIVSCVILMAYSIPACYLGSASGLTYSLLSRSVFGKWGSWFVSFNSIWVSTGWYALNAIFLSEGLRGLLSLNIDPLLFAAALAVLMAFNNFFGFKGVANFAKYLASPVLILWVVYAFGKSSLQCPHTALFSQGLISHSHALTVVSAFVLGIACWGNEADYWRYGKPRPLASLAPLTVALVLGQILFPITGWMLAKLYNVTEYAAATKLMNDYAFGGMSIISAIVLTISYVAVNDSGLYGAITAFQNLYKVPQKKLVAGLALAGTLSTIALFNYKHNFEAVAALSCIFLPCSTVIMMSEAFIIRRLSGQTMAEFSRVPQYSELPPLKWPATISLAVGCLAGTVTSGFIPGTEQYQIGVPPLQAWIVSLIIYTIWRALQCKAASQTDTADNTTALPADLLLAELPTDFENTGSRPLAGRSSSEHS